MARKPLHKELNSNLKLISFPNNAHFSLLMTFTYLFNDLLTTTTTTSFSKLASFGRMWIALKRTVCDNGFRVGSSTLNSTYNKVALNEKSAITKENLCTKYFPFTYNDIALDAKLPITKENLCIFFFHYRWS